MPQTHRFLDEYSQESHPHPERPTATLTISARRHEWGQAYRDGSLVCGRVRVTFGRDDRLGLASRERRTVIARFEDRLHPALRADLVELACRRGAAARRAAERIEPIVLMVGDPRTDRERIVGRIVPPQTHHIDLRDVEFGLRELAP
ncbi:MAG: hypothetical protein ACRDLN_02375 [Solirubrobacteraceae bacterium]